MTYQPEPDAKQIRVRYPGQYGKPQEGVLLAVHGDGAYVSTPRTRRSLCRRGTWRCYRDWCKCP